MYVATRIAFSNRCNYRRHIWIYRNSGCCRRYCKNFILYFLGDVSHFFNCKFISWYTPSTVNKTRKNIMATKYGKAAQKEVKKEMHKFKKGKAHSGKALKKVKTRKQAIAIALSKARKKGAKVPKK